jgi:hypothetical protein
MEERKFYFWLARDVMAGNGATVDLGAYVGGSTACLASGFAAAGKTTQVHAFDRFKIKSAQRKEALIAAGVPDFDGTNVRKPVRKLLAPWRDQITLHVGDVREQNWQDGEIELLIVDVAKHADTADHVAETFFPSLIPGQSVIVQQDMLNPRQPWLAAQMAMFDTYFVPLCLCHKESVSFLLTKPIPPQVVAQNRVSDLNDQGYLSAIRRTIRLLEPFGASDRLRALMANAKAYPGIRASYPLARALKETQPKS